VKVRYGEGLAIRIGPEPCVGTREGDCILRFDNVKAGILEREGGKFSDERIIVDDENNGRRRRLCPEHRQA
jgi:hypothetical protein